MQFGEINIMTWIALFAVTILYEVFAVQCTLAIIKLKSIAVANLSVMISIAGMVCVYAYAGKEGEVNNCIPILTATWLGNYYIMQREKKRAKEDSLKKDSK
jgi:hypothetical protein